MLYARYYVYVTLKNIHCCDDTYNLLCTWCIVTVNWLVTTLFPSLLVVVERRDLSHPVHSDNCILNEATGDCDKVPPAYTWRDYRSVCVCVGGGG